MPLTRQQPIDLSTSMSPRIDKQPAASNSQWGRLLSWLFPPHCLICFDNIAMGQGLCHHCRTFMRHQLSTCPRCQQQMPTPVLCGGCISRPPHFDKVIAAFRYQPPLVARIHEIKYSHRFELIEAAGICLARHINSHGSRAKLVIPVPLHSDRLRERGFDQATELARVVARELQLPSRCRALQRHRPTAPQTTVSPAQRSDNVRSAFRSQQSLAGRHVALVDDVMTTGATCNEAAKCLKQAGANGVEVWVLARA